MTCLRLIVCNLASFLLEIPVNYVSSHLCFLRFVVFLSELMLRLVRLAAEISRSFSLNIILGYLYWCIITIFNAGESYSSFFSWSIRAVEVSSGIYDLVHSLQFPCSLVHLSEFFLVHFLKISLYLTRKLPTCLSLWWDFRSRSFLEKLSRSSVVLFPSYPSSPLVWWYLNLIFPSTRSFLLSKPPKVVLIWWFCYFSWFSFLTFPYLHVTLFTPLEFFTSVLADGFSLESEWQQVSSGFQDSSQDPGRS